MQKCQNSKNVRNFMVRWMSKKAGTDSIRFWINLWTIKMKNDKCVGGVANGVDLISCSVYGVRSASRLVLSYEKLSIRGSQKCQLDMFVISIKNLATVNWWTGNYRCS